MKPSDVPIFRQLNYLAELKERLNFKKKKGFEGLCGRRCVYSSPNSAQQELDVKTCLLMSLVHIKIACSFSARWNSWNRLKAKGQQKNINTSHEYRCIIAGPRPFIFNLAFGDDAVSLRQI